MIQTNHRPYFTITQHSKKIKSHPRITLTASNGIKIAPNVDVPGAWHIAVALSAILLAKGGTQR